MNRRTVSRQQVPCDLCGLLVAVICRDARDLGDGFTETPLALAWADDAFICHTCTTASRRQHPSMFWQR